MGNYHVPFLGEGREATLEPYPLTTVSLLYGIIQIGARSRLQNSIRSLSHDNPMNTDDSNSRETEQPHLNLQRLQESPSLQQYLQLHFERAPVGYTLMDSNGYFLDWNPAAEKIFGYSKSEVVGQFTNDLIVPNSQRSYVQDIINRLSQGEMNAHGFNQNITKSGELITCEWHNTPLRKENGEVVGIFSMVQDITDRVTLEEQLRECLYQDGITKLPTRKSLEEELTEKLESVETAHRLAILHLDLVRFKTIKYTLGYQIAERLLVRIAERLQSQLPNNTLLAKVNSDEFAILLDGIATVDQATQWAEFFLELFTAPFDINGHQLFAEMKAGLVLSWQWFDQRSADSAKDLLQAAEIAVQEAKFSKTQDYAIFDPQMQAGAIAWLQLDSEMRRALQDSVFQVYYQPIVALDTGKIKGVEALLRWQKDGKWVSPEQFIPIAEETGFIAALDQWVLRQACQQMQQWQAQLYVSVNVSPIELIHPRFLREIDAILEETGLPPEQLKLEITETAVMENAEQINLVLRQLKARKIGLCLDDFGTGYSSLSYLGEFAFDIIKIDRSFVSNLERDPKNINLIQTMVFLANSFNLDITVEGIETSEQLEQLKRIGAQKGQGYLFARSLPPSGIEALLAQENWTIG